MRTADAVQIAVINNMNLEVFGGVHIGSNAPSGRYGIAQDDCQRKVSRL